MDCVDRLVIHTMSISKKNILLYILIASYLIGCATPSRFHATHAPPGSYVLAQIRAFATRQEILSIPTVVETIELSGTDRSRIHDGMMGEGRVFCCGGPNESDTSIWFYVPEGFNAAVGDVVEVKTGSGMVKGEPIQAGPNTVSRVVSLLSQVGEECRWVPENPALWARVLYCDWMEQEGWHQQGGLYNFWVKPTD
jgi:hypothetical protein